MNLAVSTTAIGNDETHHLKPLGCSASYHQLLAGCQHLHYLQTSSWIPSFPHLDKWTIMEMLEAFVSSSKTHPKILIAEKTGNL
jgi:hypothetical protein